MSEHKHKRFAQAYVSRYPAAPERGNIWHPAHPVATAFRVERERAVARAVDLLPNGLANATALEVGCGTGIPLRYLVELGLKPASACGIDLAAAYLAQAAEKNPVMDLRLGDAAEGLPWPDEHFGLVSQFVAISSIPDRTRRSKIADEMTRVCARDGHLLWYEVLKEAPGRIPDGVSMSSFARLFPGFEVVSSQRLHPIGLYRMARLPTLASIAAALPLPRTNVLILARRRG